MLQIITHAGQRTHGFVRISRRYCSSGTTAVLKVLKFPGAELSEKHPPLLFPPEDLSGDVPNSLEPRTTCSAKGIGFNRIQNVRQSYPQTSGSLAIREDSYKESGVEKTATGRLFKLKM